MKLGIEGRNAIVSGGSRGIGKGIATLLLSEGVNVVIAARTQSSIDETVEQLSQLHPGAVVGVSADMTTQAGIDRVVATAHEKFGAITISVSNVIGHVISPDKEGDGPPPGFFRTVPPNEYANEFRHLFMSAWLQARAVVPDMRAAKWGRIVNIGSGVAREPFREIPHALPNTVRPAVAAFHRHLARELAPDGITVNNILTGSIMTERNAAYWEWLAKERDTTVEVVLAGMNETLPLKRMGKVSEISSVVGMMCSDFGGVVSGQSIPVDGGMNRHL